MYIFRKTVDLERYLKGLREEGKTTAFAPTMGALHAGHYTLIALAKQEADIAIASIFVNPTQFDKEDDLVNYPRTESADIRALVENNCDILFIPDPGEIYPEGLVVRSEFELGGLDKPMEGTHRTGHFQGVCQVVNRLLEIVQPNFIVMGQKDYQQAAIIRRLLEIQAFETQLIIAPTKREEDGLAMSSRNRRLSKEERQIAPRINAALKEIKGKKGEGKLSALIAKAIEQIEGKGEMKVEYLELADAKSLEVLAEWPTDIDTVLCTAAQLGSVRLIDNELI